MNKLPIRKIPGVGKINEQILNGLGIQGCKDCMERAVEISINFTDNAFDFLIRSSLGIARNIHEDAGLKKSINCSETFQPLSEREHIKGKLLALVKELSERAKQ